MSYGAPYQQPQGAHQGWYQHAPGPYAGGAAPFGQRWRPPWISATIAFIGGLLGLCQLWVTWLEQKGPGGIDIRGLGVELNGQELIDYLGTAAPWADEYTKPAVDGIRAGIITAAIIGGVVMALAVIGALTRRSTGAAAALVLLLALVQVGIGIALVAVLDYYQVTKYGELGPGVYVTIAAGVPSLIGAIGMLLAGKPERAPMPGYAAGPGWGGPRPY